MVSKQDVYVFIYLPGETTAVPAGIFTHFPDDMVGRFAYGRRYLERRNAIPVDPVMLPLGAQPRDAAVNGGLYGAFRDACPDYWGRLVIAAEARVAPETLTDLDYLLQANASRVGNLDFRLSLDQPEPELRPPTFQALEDLLDAATRLQEGEEVAQTLLRLLEQGSSVGGARPKCTVEMDALWIAKFPAKGDTVNFPRVEYATMTLAQRCGITIPEVRVIDIGGRDVLMVKRFDRQPVDGGYERRGFLSALSLMAWDERDRTSWSYPLLADRMRSAIQAQPDQLQELFRRMVFNVLCRNTDDHPRNHGFLWGRHGLALSPAYDIVPSPARLGVGTEFLLSMSLGRKGREATLENALTDAPRFGLHPADATAVVADMQACSEGWESHFAAAGVSTADIEAVRGCFSLALWRRTK